VHHYFTGSRNITRHQHLGQRLRRRFEPVRRQQDQTAGRRVVQREGVHAAQLLEKIEAVHGIGVQDRLRVRFGARLPAAVREILTQFDAEQTAQRNDRDRARLVIQALAAVILVVALAMHWAEVGLIGLMVIVIQTAFNGVIEEHQLGRAFEEALPFTALLVVFFGIVAVIHDQHLFTPVIDFVLSLEPSAQPGMFYIANGVLSAISDNVFVATVYINEVEAAFRQGQISREHLNELAIAINTGTNIPSVATPNGQAAFLFLLTSSIAPLVRLSYGRMVTMALPYTVLMGLTGWFCVNYLL